MECNNFVWEKLGFSFRNNYFSEYDLKTFH